MPVFLLAIAFVPSLSVPAQFFARVYLSFLKRMRGAFQPSLLFSGKGLPSGSPCQHSGRLGLLGRSIWQA